VVVHGRLNAQTWTSSAGVEVTSFEVEATLVGHDLSRGTTQFTRSPAGGAQPSPAGDGRVDERPVEAAEEVAA
jgi:single-strand DNA-binding protein